MDWTKVKRKRAAPDRPAGVYANLDDLIRIQFKARDFSFRPRQPVTSVLSGRYASRLRGRGLNFEELRRYQSGDDIRTMDWKVTARTRVPHVRVYTEEKDRAVLLLVDQRIHMFFGTRQKMKSVTAAEAAALGAWRALAVGDRVGAVVFNDEAVQVVRPQRSTDTVMRILHAVLRMNHALHADSPVASNPGMLNEALRKALQLAPHDVLLVLIGDGEGADEDTDRLIGQLAAHNDVLGILVHDPTRLHLAGESIGVSDGVLQMEMDLTRHGAGTQVEEHLRREQERIEMSLRRLSAPLLMVSNEGDVVEQMRRLLGVPGRQQ